MTTKAKDHSFDTSEERAKRFKWIPKTKGTVTKNLRSYLNEFILDGGSVDPVAVELLLTAFDDLAKKVEGENLWYEFLGPDAPQPFGSELGMAKAHCGLCGDHGVIDTVGRIQTPTRYECGVLRFCICPNGRAMKEGYDGCNPDDDYIWKFWEIRDMICRGEDPHAT